MNAPILLLLALLAVPAPLPAEEPPDPERPQAGFVDSVEVRLVDLVVQVSDRKGRRVIDLERDDFEVFEDGQRVEIGLFRAPRPAAPGIVEAPRSSPGRPAEPARLAASRGPTLREPPLHLLLFVDTTNLRLHHRRQLFRDLKKSLSREPGSLRLMLVTYDGKLRVRHGFDSPTEQVLETLAEIEGGRMVSAGESSRRAEELAAVATELASAARASNPASARAAAESRRDSALAELQAYAESERHEVLRTLEVLRQLAFSLGGIAGRKSILYAGDELTMAPAAELYTAADLAFGGGGPQGTPASGARRLDLYRDFEGLVRQANASGVTFYTLTPPSHQHLGDVTIGTLGPPGYESSIRSEKEARIKEAACLMSQTTGGLCQSGGSDFRLLIDDTLEDLGTFYSLGYVPDRPADGEFHRIEVKVKRRGLRIRHREGYVDRTANDRLRERLAAALWFDAWEDDLGVEVSLEEQRPLDNRSRFVVPVQVTVPAAAFALVPSADRDVRTARGRLFVLAATGNGRLVTAEEFPLAFEVEAAKLASQTEVVYAHRLDLHLGPGVHRLAVGLWDEVAQQGSFLSRSVAVGAADGLENPRKAVAEPAVIQ